MWTIYHLAGSAEIKELSSLTTFLLKSLFYFSVTATPKVVKPDV